jgi:hypothetical protein
LENNSSVTSCVEQLFTFHLSKVFALNKDIAIGDWQEADRSTTNGGLT